MRRPRAEQLDRENKQFRKFFNRDKEGKTQHTTARIKWLWDPRRPSPSKKKKPTLKGYVIADYKRKQRAQYLVSTEWKWFTWILRCSRASHHLQASYLWWWPPISRFLQNETSFIQVFITAPVKIPNYLCKGIGRPFPFSWLRERPMAVPFLLYHPLSLWDRSQCQA